MSHPLELPLPLVHGAAVPPAVPSVLGLGDNERVIALAQRAADAWDCRSSPASGVHPVTILLGRFAKWAHESGAHEARRKMATDSHTRPPVQWHRRSNTRPGKDPRLADWGLNRQIARTVSDRVFRLAVLRPNPHTLVLADRLDELDYPSAAAALRGEMAPGAWAGALCRLLGLREDPITTELLHGALDWTGMSPRLYGEHEPGGAR